jgi:hypothetical protein
VRKELQEDCGMQPARYQAQPERHGSKPGKGQEQRANAQSFFLRENPIPTVIGALALGVAIGLAIRYASSSAERESESKSPLENVDLSFLSLPFLWPVFKSMRRRYDDSLMQSEREWID